MKRIVAILLFLLGLSSCERYSAEPEEDPYIEWFSFPDTVYTLSGYDIIVTAKVIKNDNFKDNTAVVHFFPEMINLTPVNMTDNGSGADIIKYDGVYSGTVNSTYFSGFEGEYFAEFYLETGLQSEGLSKTYTSPKPSWLIQDKAFVVLNEKRNIPPGLSNLSCPQKVSIDSFDNEILSVTVIDNNGNTDIEKVTCDIYFPYEPTPELTLELNDAGINGDVSANDSVYTMLLSPNNIADVGRGKYTFLIYAVDKKGNRSNEIHYDIEFYSTAANLPPEILKVNAPDSVEATGGYLYISCEVNDPDGLANIKRVFFRSYKPDGSPSSGNPFYMYDDGSEIIRDGVTSGDSIKNDGIFTLKVYLPANTTPGTYHFVFEAVDKAGNRSNNIDHALTVR